jgi:hypothetical protein
MLKRGPLALSLPLLVFVVLVEAVFFEAGVAAPDEVVFAG